MARIKNILDGKLRGRLGNILFFNREGHTYIRPYPLQRNDPHTLLQEQQRNRMRAVMELYQTIRQTPLASSWVSAARRKGRNPVNLFISINIAAFTGEGEIGDYDKLHFSCGTLPPSDNFQAEWLAQEGVVEVRWQTKRMMKRCRCADRLLAVAVYDGNAFEIVTAPEGAPRREDGCARIPLPANDALPRHLYCFFADEYSGEYSDDIYCAIHS